MSFSFQRVNFTYDGGETPALSDVSLEIPHGRTTALLGVSGSGKSTTLALASLLQPPKDAGGRVIYAGEITYHNPHGREEPANYCELDGERYRQLRLSEFGIVLQWPFLLPHFTCLDNIAMRLALSGMNLVDCRKAAGALMKDADLDHIAERLPNKVSGGERQRVAVLRAMVHNPRVIFADEPVSNSDYKNAKLVLNLLQRWQHGELHEETADRPREERTLILVTHAVQTAWDLAENFIVLHCGRVVDGGVRHKSTLGAIQRLWEMMEGQS